MALHGKKRLDICIANRTTSPGQQISPPRRTIDGRSECGHPLDQFLTKNTTPVCRYAVIFLPHVAIANRNHPQLERKHNIEGKGKH